MSRLWKDELGTLFVVHFPLSSLSNPEKENLVI